MQENITVTGIVIKTEPIGEYDRRVVILTKERGKISAFAKGSRKPSNRLMAPTNPFAFGQFRLYEGRSSYTLSEADITNYFEALRSDYIGAYYGMYFMEICDYYTRENNDETLMLKLIYQSLRALTSPKFDDKLVRCIFELKAIAINGEFTGVSDELSISARFAANFIFMNPPEKLFSFNVTPEVLEELRRYSTKMRKEVIDRDFKSLEILENIE
jgi:DNA repair protein RecO (recombination protein O)